MNYPRELPPPYEEKSSNSINPPHSLQNFGSNSSFQQVNQAQSIYPQLPHPQASYPQTSFPQVSYSQASYNQISYPQLSYTQPFNAQPFNLQPSYPQPLYPQPSYYQNQPHVQYKALLNQKKNVTVIDQNLFDSSARFDKNKPITIPPPPPGVCPNIVQMAVAQGQKVVVGKKKSNFFTGGKGAGSVFW